MAANLESILGVSQLKSKAGASVPLTDLNGKYVLLYFSAHWCPPCRQFTPLLAEWYKSQRNASRNDFEVIFVSWDRSNEQFEEYYEAMPWLALPFDTPKDKMNKRFKVEGIPTLIVLDKDDSREVITKEARNEVLGDPSGLPWKPKSFGDIMADNDGKLLTSAAAGGAPTTWAALSAKHDAIAIYFSAHWCPPCRQFTPHLASLYTAGVAAAASSSNPRSAPAIIFASRDKSQEQYDEYFGSMPWHALPYNDSRVAALARRFKLQGIPTLVTINTADGSVINEDAASAARSDDAEWPFRKLPFPVWRAFQADEITVTPLQEGDVVAILDTQNCTSNDEEAAVRAIFKQAAETIYPEHGDGGSHEVKVRFMFTNERKSTVKLTPEEVSKCPAGHPLAIATRRSARCDVCRKPIENTCHNCPKCDFDRCNECFETGARAPPQSLGLLSQVERVTSVGPSTLSCSVLIMREQVGERHAITSASKADDIVKLVKGLVEATSS